MARKIHTGYLFLLMAVFLGQGCLKEKCPAPKIKEVNDLIVAKKYDEAQKAIQSIKETHPECPDAFYLEGLALELTNAFSEAEKAYTQALQFESDSCPGMTDALTGRAWARVRKGEYAEAEVDFRSAIAIGTCSNSREPKAWLQISLANCLYELKRMSDAEDELNHILNSDATDMHAQAYYQRGRVRLALSQFEIALADFQLVRSSKMNAMGWVNWFSAECLRGLAMPDSACKEVNRAWELKNPLALQDSICPHP